MQEIRFNVSFCRCVVKSAEAHELHAFTANDSPTRYQNMLMRLQPALKHVPAEQLASLCSYYNVPPLPARLGADSNAATPANLSSPCPRRSTQEMQPVLASAVPVTAAPDEAAATSDCCATAGSLAATNSSSALRAPTADVANLHMQHHVECKPGWTENNGNPCLASHQREVTDRSQVEEDRSAGIGDAADHGVDTNHLATREVDILFDDSGAEDEQPSTAGAGQHTVQVVSGQSKDCRLASAWAQTGCKDTTDTSIIVASSLHLQAEAETTGKTPPQCSLHEEGTQETGKEQASAHEAVSCTSGTLCTSDTCARVGIEACCMLGDNTCEGQQEVQAPQVGASGWEEEELDPFEEFLQRRKVAAQHKRQRHPSGEPCNQLPAGPLDCEDAHAGCTERQRHDKRGSCAELAQVQAPRKRAREACGYESDGRDSWQVVLPEDLGRGKGQKGRGGEASPGSAWQSEIRLLVHRFVGGLLEPLLARKYVNIRQYTEVIGRAVEKILKVHGNARDASFLDVEAKKICRLVDKYVAFVRQTELEGS
jgi:hypothetical protein